MLIIMLIGLSLYLVAGPVMLDNQRGPQTVEVNDVLADGSLPSET